MSETLFVLQEINKLFLEILRFLFKKSSHLAFGVCAGNLLPCARELLRVRIHPSAHFVKKLSERFHRLIAVLRVTILSDENEPSSNLREGSLG